MPIRLEGTDEHAHFKALYETVIRPALDEIGMQVSRADEVARPGAITSQVIERLASADLVIADLTGGNPNVFYELGVRHALRSTGTVMLVDTSRTERVPFDLQSYRIIQYTADLRGASELKNAIQKAWREVGDDPATHDRPRDNPVHDTLRSLPENIPASASGTLAGGLRERIADLEETLRGYRQRFGDQLGEIDSHTALQDIVDEALDRARSKTLATDLVERAEAAAQQQDSEAYLTAVRALIDPSVGYARTTSTRWWLGLSARAQ